MVEKIGCKRLEEEKEDNCGKEGIGNKMWAEKVPEVRWAKAAGKHVAFK